MKATPQLLLEADRCFQYVCEKMEADRAHPRSILFGSTLQMWLEEIAGGEPTKIIVAGKPPSDAYRRMLRTGKVQSMRMAESSGLSKAGGSTSMLGGGVGK